MKHINVEIKAKCFHPEKVKAFLLNAGARFTGTDLQTDIYFNVPSGRLKLRSGNIENNLIYYQRSNIAGPKQSNFQLVKVENTQELAQLLTDALGVKVVVRKKREIYYLGNIKIHLDELEGLGNFVEIEAGNIHAPTKTVADLRNQCEYLVKAFEIMPGDLIEHSYSDMLLDDLRK